MFEQSVLSSVPKGKRIWTTCLGVTGQVFLVVAMVMAPMLWPQVLPPATFTILVPSPPPGPPVRGKQDAKPTHHARAARPFQIRTGFVQPPVPINPPELINDAPDVGDGNFVSGGVPGGGGGFGPGVMNGIMTDVSLIPPPVTPTPPPAKARPEAVATVAPVIRVPVGGDVKAPRLIRRVDPPYPPIARNARVSGVVKLSGVISVNGRITELSVESGNVLLVRAALEAVAQWVYEPTLLNGKPVEVATTIIVTFTLGQ